ncbi:citrate synthase [Pseudacidovorax intermedius]|uniref:Citrate synthase n=2 Tax=Pseudacidovorax intermedius TaxID=433924 RepID=A0A370FMV4_9BURK|nr:citrate synthase/methylcitrate synthase [Pseudacidovorax intermedius]RDI29056.1 citrate synthase [Pseudacidovorax intermedius]
MTDDDNNGLEGVVAAHTVLSEVDGAAGRLVLRGHALDDIAGRWRYEDMLALLWQDFFAQLPSAPELALALGRARTDVAALLRADDHAMLSALTPLEAMRALLARVPDGDDLPTALRLVAAPVVFTAAVLRWKAGEPALVPEPEASHAADFLRMVSGRPATWAQAAALDAYLVTVADHGLNASTFAARVVASTGAGLASAVLAGLSALKGPLHGGAPGPVLDMLDAIGHADAAAHWLEAALDRGERLMGFGHRIYRVRDPRADALKKALRQLAQAGGVEAGRVALAEAVERTALASLQARKPGRVLETNVEFYTALLLEAVGLPREAFTAVFAAGRVGGWVAHAREQVQRGRLIRPQSVYVGPAPAAATRVAEPAAV